MTRLAARIKNESLHVRLWCYSHGFFDLPETWVLSSPIKPTNSTVTSTGLPISDINECDSNPCLNNATCNEGINSYNCTCEAGYQGTNCETGTRDFPFISLLLTYSMNGMARIACNDLNKAFM